MKKYIYLTIIGVVVFFVSCNDIKDAIEVGIRTEIKVDLPVISQNTMAIGSMSNDIYSFVGGGTFSLTDIPELQKYMDNLRSISAEDGSVISFAGAADGNKVLSLNLKYGIVITKGEEPAMNTVFNYSGGLSAKDGVIQYLSDLWSPILIGALDANKDKVFALKIEGTANYNVNSTVKMIVPVKVSASPLL
jgi:hypothetical protein